MMTLLRLRVGLALAAMSGAVAAAPLSPEVAAAFRDLAELRTGEALRRFEELAQETRDDAESVQLGLALTQLAAQPRTPARLADAETRFRRLADSGHSGDVAIAARYHLIRLRDWQRSPDEPVAPIVEAWSAFHRLYPDHVYGQMAVARAAMLDIYSRASGEEALRAGLAHWGQLSRSLSDPMLRSSFEVVLADAAADLLRDDALSRRHLLAVEEIGVATPQTTRRVRVRLIMIAQAMGNRAEVERRLREFAELYPHEAVLPQMRALLRGGEVSP